MAIVILINQAAGCDCLGVVSDCSVYQDYCGFVRKQWCVNMCDGKEEYWQEIWNRII